MIPVLYLTTNNDAENYLGRNFTGEFFATFVS